MTDKTTYPSPPCPLCAAATTLKEVQHETKAPGVTAFFQCGSCATLYPRFIETGLAMATGLLRNRDG